jgi:hypothetical protein
MKARLIGRLGLLMLGLSIALPCAWVRAGDSPDPAKELPKVKHELAVLRKERAHDLVRMNSLESKVDAVLERDQKLESENAQLKADHQLFQKQATAEIKDLQTKVQAPPSPAEVSDMLGTYWGQHRFLITGSAAGTFLYDRMWGTNSFGAQFEPYFLYRMNDWIAFEAEIEAKLPSDAESEFNLEVAMAHLFLNDHLEVQAGKWFLPFGDFIEDLHPFWVNRFVSNPLPYREGDDGGMVPVADIGVQARGAVQWGALGQDLDYVAYISNGPNYDTEISTPLAGQMWNFPNNVDVSKHSKGFGARLRVYPIPLHCEMGRLELGVSTYDGKWASSGYQSKWFNSYGLSFAYMWNELETRGEWLETWRQMPMLPGGGQIGSPYLNATDHRQGWYYQLGYQLAKLDLPAPLDQFNDAIHRTELLVRYSGQNQRAFVMPEIPTSPGGAGGDVSASTFVPHAREVALGIDYFIAPSIVWKLEYDIEVPHSGGYIIDPDKDTSSPAGAPNDHAFITQLAIGF